MAALTRDALVLEAESDESGDMVVVDDETDDGDVEEDDGAA